MKFNIGDKIRIHYLEKYFHLDDNSTIGIITKKNKNHYHVVFSNGAINKHVKEECHGVWIMILAIDPNDILKGIL